MNGGPRMGTQWKTLGSWRSGENIPDRRCGLEGRGRVMMELHWDGKTAPLRPVFQFLRI